MFPDVWMAVVGAAHEHCAASICGFQRRAVKGADYPCLIESDENDKVEGVVYFDLTDVELNLLDQFEAEQYERRTVDCTCSDKLLKTEVYIWRSQYRELVGGEWDVDWFRREGIHRFLGR